MDQHGNAGSPDMVLGEAHILAPQPGRKEILDGQTGRTELVGREHEAEREHYVGQSKT